MSERIAWPEGRDFAFTVFDDTDFATVENVRPVYDLLAECGLRTTKSVWPTRGPATPLVGGATCEDPAYLKWVQGLKGLGFEIGYHLATFHTSPRPQTLSGLERFVELFGHNPRSMANHYGCEEGIYWGRYRLSGVHRTVYDLAMLPRGQPTSRGHVEGHPLFWGDLCRERIEYVRNFVFPDINTLKACPVAPYHDPGRPWVNYWYAASDGSNGRSFTQCISEANQDRLEQEGGACIMYTHFACSFCSGGVPTPRFRDLIRRLSRKNGWFVPVSTLLDFLRARQPSSAIAAGERRRLERRWLQYKLRVGTT